MQSLYKRLEKYTIKDAIYFEEKDRQFLALKKLYTNKRMDNIHFLFLIVVNSLVCYQLSGKGEDYWEEFSSILENKEFKNFIEIYNFFKIFLKNSKNNKRFINTKLKRIKKVEDFYSVFLKNILYFSENMEVLLNTLSKIMNQKNDAKTLVFAIKMFSYGTRNIFGFQEISKNINIPIDSRLEKLFVKYNKEKQGDIKKYYLELSQKLEIPQLHLDAILWVNYDKLIN